MPDFNPIEKDFIARITSVIEKNISNYESAYRYYKKFIVLKEQQQLEIFKEQNLAIGIVFAKMGLKEKSEEFVRSFKDFADNDPSIYKHLHLATYYSYRGNSEKALEHLRLFSNEENYLYWILLLPNDPSVEAIKDLPAFKKVMARIETKFWSNHKKIKDK